ncbi:hypothetical protein SAMN04488570_0344 [Nocardioides scoriae]|uniref:Uncharacterized protein n=1 Tax=Nocardioides scoriae TaxID=642780 RepID=A0A1H1LSN2_9ACTN|nr:hypothetical protein [Nocardioides scoriae]SDR77503.1 hypothetical protein SAMN04488570_0344 [Nocardioides scoriae]
MEAEHRRPLVAFLAVLCLVALIVGQNLAAVREGVGRLRDGARLQASAPVRPGEVLTPRAGDLVDPQLPSTPDVVLTVPDLVGLGLAPAPAQPVAPAVDTAATTTVENVRAAPAVTAAPAGSGARSAAPTTTRTTGGTLGRSAGATSGGTSGGSGERRSAATEHRGSGRDDAQPTPTSSTPVPESPVAGHDDRRSGRPASADDRTGRRTGHAEAPGQQRHGREGRAAATPAPRPSASARTATPDRPERAPRQGQGRERGGGHDRAGTRGHSDGTARGEAHGKSHANGRTSGQGHAGGKARGKGH